MTDDMSIQSYLEAGGVLSNPTNVPPRYRAELLKLMATFVDSELAGAAGFADIINAGPGIKERIAAARIVMEKTGNADRVLTVMGAFGVDTNLYANQHPWTARLARDADIGATRTGHDMRLAVFNYPLDGWADGVVMNLLMGHAVGVQMDDFATLSYQPLAEAFRVIAPIEAHHVDLAHKGLQRLLDSADKTPVQASVDYWWPRVAASFGSASSASSSRAERLKAIGLRRTDNAQQRSSWETRAGAALQGLGLGAG